MSNDNSVTMRHVRSSSPEAARMIATAKANGITNLTGTPTPELRARVTALRSGSPEPRHEQGEEFELLREDIAALRADIAALDGNIQSDLQALFDAVIVALDQPTPTSTARRSTKRKATKSGTAPPSPLSLAARLAAGDKLTVEERMLIEARRHHQPTSSTSTSTSKKGETAPPPPSLQRHVQARARGASLPEAMEAARGGAA